MKGTVFNIQRFSINDGPGIRTTVFLKGCPLSCIWCHNPESKLTKREVLFNKSKCITCGACGVVCDNRAHVFEDGEHSLKRDLCIACGRCADVCPMKGLEALDSVAAELGITPQYLSRLFCKNAGVGFSQYLTRARLEKAAFYLKETNLTVTEIAYEVGYRDLSHFMRSFKKYFGVTPLGYKKAQINQ